MTNASSISFWPPGRPAATGPKGPVVWSSSVLLMGDRACEELGVNSTNIRENHSKTVNDQIVHSCLMIFFGCIKVSHEEIKTCRGGGGQYTEYLRWKSSFNPLISSEKCQKSRIRVIVCIIFIIPGLWFNFQRQMFRIIVLNKSHYPFNLLISPNQANCFIFKVGGGGGVFKR